MKEIKAFKCSHCGKIYQRKGNCVKHEIDCGKNPENSVSCLSGCQFLTKKETSIYYDNPMGGDIERKVDLFFCIEPTKKHFLHPPMVHKKKSWFETDPIENVCMPKDCNKFREIQNLWDSITM